MTLPYWACECGKRSYMSKGFAKRAGKATGPGLRPYRCVITHEWHVGHRDPCVSRDMSQRYQQWKFGVEE
jgi:hypothetical protein